MGEIDTMYPISDLKLGHLCLVRKWDEYFQGITLRWLY